MKLTRRGLIRWGLLLVTLALLFFIGRPVAFLTWVWLHDPAEAPPPATAGVNDASGLNATKPGEVIPVAGDPAAAEQQIVDLVKRATKEDRKIVISGARHSMGGHVLYPGAIVLDMLSFHAMSLDAANRVLTVGAGARWSQVIPYLDHHGFAVEVMQSNNDFTIGGSLSVDCHGWQPASPPIASTVLSFRLVTADGKIQRCSRTENPELFSLVLGGYGLFGVILDVQLRVVPNEFYQAEARPVAPKDYAGLYAQLAMGQDDIGLAYGRISVAPDSFFQEAEIVVFKRVKPGRPVTDTLIPDQGHELNRLVFRGSVGSDYGKNLRWTLEKWFGEKGGAPLSRNQIMNEPADWYASHDPNSTEVLHEYFIPASRLGEFIEKARPVFLKHHQDLLNITVRRVETDHDAFLRYAREPVFGLVMLFHQGLDAASEDAMRSLTQDVIAVTLECGGTYYLPYRPHATAAQFAQAYPQAKDFFAAKLRYDPNEIFMNDFYQNYGLPLLGKAAPAK